MNYRIDADDSAPRAMSAWNYRLSQAPDASYAWFAAGRSGQNALDPGFPDMQLLGWSMEEKGNLIRAAEAWIAERGLSATVEVMK